MSFFNSQQNTTPQNVSPQNTEESTLDLNRFLGRGLGAVFGTTVAFLLYMTFWVLLGGPAQEVIERHLLDRWRRKRHRRKRHRHKRDHQGKDVPAERPLTPEANTDNCESEVDQSGAPYRILVSDIHIDTWQEHPERYGAFVQFLEVIHQTPEVSEVFLNGDLMDIPLHPLHAGAGEPLTFDQQKDQWPGIFATSNLPLLEAISALRQPRPNGASALKLYYFTGNHDVGISGLRFAQFNLTNVPANVIWNPSGLIRWPSESNTEAQPSGEHRDKQPKQPAIYMEHGHLHDPLLWLYMRYAILDLLRGDSLRILKRSQKAGKFGQGSTQARQKAISPKAITPSSSVVSPSEVASETKSKDGVTTSSPPRRTGAPQNLNQALQTSKSTAEPQQKCVSVSATLDWLGDAIIRYRYRHAARLAKRRLEKARPDLQVNTVVMGHTHLLDAAQMIDNKGHEWEYINAASWAGNTRDQIYWVIASNGILTGPFQWRENETLRLTCTPTCTPT